MAKRKTTSYTRNRNRILNYVRRQRKKGYDIDVNIPTERQLRSQGVAGSKLTKYTNMLKKLTPKNILNYSSISFQQETEVPIISQISDLKPIRINYDNNFYTNVVINNWYNELANFMRGEAYHLILAWSNTLINENGRDAFAKMIADGYENGYILTWEIVYNMTQANNYLSDMIKFLYDQGKIYSAEIQERIDMYIRNLSEGFEYMETWELPV